MIHNNITQSLQVFSEMVIFTGQKIATKPHSHHALEIILTENSSFSVHHDNKVYEVNGVMLRPDIMHETHGDESALFIFFDPESNFSKQLNTLIKSGNILCLTEEVVKKLYNYFNGGLQFNYCEQTIKQYLLEILFHSASHSSLNFKIDARISNVIHYIRTSMDNQFNIKQLTEVACLSESRLFHLFKDEIGIPIRRYILWCRIQDAVKRVLIGSTLTEAAQICGFSDVAHLNRTFVSMFGISPSHILKKT